MKAVILFKHSFKKKIRGYFLGNIKYFVIAITDLVLSYLIIRNITINTIFVWFGVFIAYTIANSLLITGIFKIMGSLDSLSRIKSLFKRGA